MVGEKLRGGGIRGRDKRYQSHRIKYQDKEREQEGGGGGRKNTSIDKIDKEVSARSCSSLYQVQDIRVL